MRRRDPGRGDPRVHAQWRQARRLRALALLAAAAVLLGALPGFLLIRAAVRDPVFAALDGLRLPGWAARNPTSAATGNRWCLRSCRLRERLYDSDRDTTPTDQAYRVALRRAGWYPSADPGCPVPADGIYSCWRRDQYVLDLWTRVAVCPQPTPRLPGSGPPNSVPPGSTRPGSVPPGSVAAGSAPPGSAPSGSAPSGSAASGGRSCAGAKVTIKVTERINPYWH